MAVAVMIMGFNEIFAPRCNWVWRDIAIYLREKARETEEVFPHVELGKLDVDLHLMGLFAEFICQGDLRLVKIEHKQLAAQDHPGALAGWESIYFALFLTDESEWARIRTLQPDEHVYTLKNLK